MSEPGNVAVKVMELLSKRRGTTRSVTPRERAALRDISPCSEYTRFTMEGTLKDPFSELSVLLDVPSLGTLFTNGPLTSPRWSPALGYGLAVIEDDTRVHLYRSGKFVIRRARDRDHVEACYRFICDLARPSIIIPGSGLTLFEAVSMKHRFGGDIPSNPIAQALSWPENGPLDDKAMESFIEGPIGVRSTLRDIIIPDMVSSLSSGEPDGMVSGIGPIKGRVLASLGSSMSQARWEGLAMSSTACIHLSSLTALDLLSEGASAINAADGGNARLIKALGSLRKGDDLTGSIMERASDLELAMLILMP